MGNKKSKKYSVDVRNAIIFTGLGNDRIPSRVVSSPLDVSFSLDPITGKRRKNPTKRTEKKYNNYY